jgi:hypothetical protein
MSTARERTDDNAAMLHPELLARDNRDAISATATASTMPKQTRSRCGRNWCFPR